MQLLTIAIDNMHGLADVLEAAEKALADVPYGQCAVFDTLLDKLVYLRDFRELAAAIHAIADAVEAHADAAREAQYEARLEMAREPDQFGEPW